MTIVNFKHNKIIARAVAVICDVVLMLSACSIAASALGTEEPWAVNATYSNLSSIASIEKGEKEFIMTVNVGGTEEALSLSFPSFGGIRFHSRVEGYFTPSELLDITYNTAANGSIILTSGSNTKVIINTAVQPWTMEVYNASNRMVTSFTGNDMAFGYDNSGKMVKVKLSGNLSANEVIYGFGERFNSFNRRGYKTTLWQWDSWSSEDTSYKNIPIMHSSKGYTLFFDSAYCADVDIGAAEVGNYSLDFRGPKFDFFVWTNSPLQNINSYCSLTGASILPPKWALRYIPGGADLTWENNDQYDPDYSYNKLVTAIEGYERLGITDLGSFYGEDTYGSNAKALNYLKQRGIRYLGWINVIHEYTGALWYLPDTSLTGRTPTYRDINNPTAFNYSNPIIDVSNPTASEFLAGKYWEQIENGVKGFLVDYGELVTNNSYSYSGMPGLEIHNFSSYFYSKAVNEMMKKVNGDDFLLFARNAAIGGQRWACNTSGDQPTDTVSGHYEGLERAIKGMLSFTSSGFSLYGCDIGGLGGGETGEMYRRWMEFGTFNGLMRAHGGDPDENPWNKTSGDGTSQFATDTFLDCYWLRENLLDLSYSAAVEANRYGKPVTQAMPVAFPGHTSTLDNWEQFMYGDNLLVATVSTKGTYSRPVDLPNGTWTDLYNGTVYEGGKTVYMDAPQDRIPVLVRSGSVIPVRVSGNTLNIIDSMSDKNIVDTLMITAPNGTRTTEVWRSSDDGTTFTSAASGSTFTVAASKAQNTRVIIAQGINAKGVTVDGNALTKLSSNPTNQNSVGYYVDGHNRTVIRVGADWRTVAVNVGGTLAVDLAKGTATNANLTDGNPDSSINLGTSGSLKIDLGAQKSFSEVVVKWTKPLANQSYTVQYSTNNSSWSTAATVSGGNGMIDTFKFAPVTARYLRITSNNKSGNVYEINVYGTESEGAAPNMSAVTDETGGYIKNVIDDSLLVVNDGAVPYNQPDEIVIPDTSAEADVEDAVAYSDGTKSKDYMSGWTTAGQRSKFQSDFEIHHSKNAKNGIKKVTFGTRMLWETNGSNYTGSLQHKKDVGYENYGIQYNDIITTVLDKTVKYHNFSISFDIAADNYSSTASPGIVFGIKDKAEWVTSKNGGFIIGMKNEPDLKARFYLNGYDAEAGKYVEFESPRFRMTTQSDRYTLTVTVLNGKAFVSAVSTNSGVEAASYSFCLPENYTGGYVGMALRDEKYTIYGMKLTDMGGTTQRESTETFSNFSSEAEQTRLKTSFTVLHDRDGKDGMFADRSDIKLGFNADSFSKYFSFDSNTLKFKPNVSVDGTSFWERYDKNVTRLLYNKKLYNFEFKAKVVGADIDTYGDLVDYFIPSVVFGVENDACFRTIGGGSEFGINYVPYEAGYFTYGINDDAAYKFNITKEQKSSGHCGGKYDGYYIVKVKDGKVTFTVTQFGGDFKASKTYDLPENYKGGYVGLQLQACPYNITEISVTELEGTYVPPEEPEEPEEPDEPEVTDETYDFSDLSAVGNQNAFTDSFYTYRGTNVLNNHTLEPVNFADYFKFENGKLVRSGSTISNFNDLYPTYWNNRTRLALSVGKLQNFKLTFSSFASYSDAFGYSIPIIHFGMDKVDEFATENSGYTAQVSYWPNTADEGRVYIEKRTAAGATELGADREVGVYDSIYGGQYGMEYSLEVNEGFVTYTVSHDWGADGIVYWTATANIEDYKAGYLAIDFIDGVCDISNLKLEASVVEDTALAKPPVPTSFNYGNYSADGNLEKFSKDFSIYRQNGTPEFEKVDFGDYFSKSGDYMLFTTPDDSSNINGETFWGTYQNYRTRIIFNKGKMSDFTISVTANGGGTDAMGDWKFPNILFGLSDVTATGDGDVAYIEFNPGNTSYIHFSGEDFDSYQSAGNYCGGKYQAVYTLTVKDGKITYNVYQFGGDVNVTYTQDLPQGFGAGYIGFDIPDTNMVIGSVSISGTMLPDTELEPQEINDPTGDGTIDDKDLDYLMDCLLGITDYTYNENLDYYKDGKFDIRDIVAIRYFLESQNS